MTLPLDRVLQQASPVLPVLVIEDVALAPDLAARVVCGRRHGAGSDAAHAAGAGRDRRHPSRGARGPAGAGTLIHTEQFLEARDAGAQFAVSPGCTPRLAAAAEDAGLPYLPG